MLPLVRAGGDGGQGLEHMLVGDAPQMSIFLQLPNDAIKAPGAAEVQTVEVDELPVLAVGDLSWGEGEFAVTELREKILQPDGEFFPGKNPAHDVGLFKAWRKKIETARLPGHRAALIGQKKVLRPRFYEILELPVSGRLCIIPSEAKTECGIAVFADADGIEKLRQKFQVPLHDQVGQRPQIVLQLPGQRIVECVELLGELQQSGPAVGPLK